MRVYVIRHTSLKNIENICYGQSEVPVSDSFDKEAKILKNKLPKNFDKQYSSPSERCVILQKKLSLPAPIFFDKRLMELNFGLWENKPWNSINQKLLNQWMNNFVTTSPPKGENLEELFSRTLAFLKHLESQEDKTSLVITHSGVIRCIWLYLLDIPLENMFKIPVGFNEVFIFELNQKKSYNKIIQKQ